MSDEYFRKLVNFSHDPRLPEDQPGRSDVEAVLQDGFVVIENVIPKDKIDAMKAEVNWITDNDTKTEQHIQGARKGEIHMLLNRTRLFDEYCLLPRTLALNKYFLTRGFLLSGVSTTQIIPGEEPEEMHHEDDFVDLVRPRAPMVITVMIALDDFNVENGAAMVVPGSHTWDAKRRPTDSEAVPAVCSAGSILYVLGTTWKCNKPNITEKQPRMVTIQYCQPYIRPAENMFLGVDPRRLEEIPAKIVEMMGYAILPPFIGYVDGLNPLKAARRMVDWLQQPLEPSPPAFMV